MFENQEKLNKKLIAKINKDEQKNLVIFTEYFI